MPRKKNKNSFNLISKELQLKRSFKGERDWYMTVNVLIVGTVIAFAALSYVFSIYLDVNINSKKQELVNIANKQVYTTSRSFLKSKISVLNDKFTLYQEIKSQNFDLNKFYKDIESIYPGLQIQKFTVRPDSSNVEVDVMIAKNGYQETPKFLSSLANSKRFSGYSVKNMNFQQADQTSDQINTADVTVQISLNLPKNDPSLEQ